MGTNFQALGLPADRGERHDHYREKIRRAAEVEFAIRGYRDARVLSITRRAEVSPATVRRFYAGKTELWNTLHLERARELREAVMAAYDPGLGPSDQIVESAGALVVYFAENPSFLDLQLSHGLSWATADDGVFGVGGQGQVWADGRRLLLAALRRARDAGELVDVPDEVAAGMLIATVQVWLDTWARSRRHQSPAVLAGAVVDHLRSCLLTKEQRR